jgi:TolA-binding protein
MNRAFRTIWGSLGGAVLLSIALSACGTVPPAPVAAVHRNDASAGESSVVQSLHRQLRERDKRIEELESQLNVLKLIDQDVETRKKPSRTPATLTPIE